MDKHAQLEKSLEQLMPAAVSDEANQVWNQEIELCLKDLESRQSDLPVKGRFRLSALITSAAACLIIGFSVATVFHNNQDELAPDEMILTETPKEKSLYEVLSSTKWVESQKEEGVELKALEGKQHQIPLRKTRFRIVTEERLRDPETGTIVRLRQPSEEVLWEPLSE